jgi:hypothetical protein
MSSKYDALGGYLVGRQADEVPMSFQDIEAVIGAALPPKAVNYPAWWSNNASNNTMTKVWLDAGFRSERVDIGGRKLVFRRVREPSLQPGLREAGGKYAVQSSAIQGSRHGPGGLIDRVRTAMAGTVFVAEGVDLTAPSGEIWDAQAG